MSPKPGLVDHLGRPIEREKLTQRLAGATVTGVRQAVAAQVSRGLSPQRLASIMRSADDNDPEAYMQLAEEIEEKDLHYLSVLGTRKRQVAQLDITLEAASEAAKDQAIAKAAEECLIDGDVLADYMFDMLDAVGKGFSLGEMMWKTSASRWTIDAIEHVDPRFLRFDRATMRIPMLVDELGQHQPLAPYKFVFLELKAKSGIPMRGGLIRPAAWTYLFKNFTLKDWLQFCDVYGLPLRVGKYAPGAAEKDKDELLRAVASIAVDAAGIIPQNMEIEFIEAANKGGSADFFDRLIDYCDKQVSKAVLGQTGTTDATPGKLGGSEDHTMVREDIERADARAVSAAINRQIVRAFVDLNFGPQAAYPKIRIGRAEEADAAMMVDAATRLVPLGLRVRADDIRNAVGFTEPKDGEEVLTAPAPLGLPPFMSGAAEERAPQNATKAAAAVLATAIAAQAEAGDAIDRAAAESLSDWQAVIGPPVAQIMAVAAEAASLEDFKARLTKLYPALEMGPLAGKLAGLTFQALAGGYAGDELEQ